MIRVDVFVAHDEMPGPADLDAVVGSMMRQTMSSWRLVLPAGAQLARRSERSGQVMIGRPDRRAPYTTVAGIGDEFHPRAFEVLLGAIESSGSVLSYADAIHDHIEVLKPACSPTRLWHRRYTGDPFMVASQVFDDVVADATTPSESELHDVALTSARRGELVHVPEVLLRRLGHSEHRVSPEPVRRHLAELGVAAVATREGSAIRIDPDPEAHAPTVEIVIPTAGAVLDSERRRERAVDRCLQSLRPTVERPEVGVTLVVDESMESAEVEQLTAAHLGLARIMNRPPGPFDFGAAIDAAVLSSSAQYVLVLNDDIEVRGPDDWLDRMLVHGRRDDVGVVGAHLSYPDGTLQHAGMAFVDGLPLHVLSGHRSNERCGWIEGARDVAAVTGACMLVSRDDYLSVGGFSAEFPLSFGDVDLCLKLGLRGLTTVVVDDVDLIHHESLTRVPRITAEEQRRWFARWGAVSDPWYHPRHVDAPGRADHAPPPRRTWPTAFAELSPRHDPRRGRIAIAESNQLLHDVQELGP